MAQHDVVVVYKMVDQITPGLEKIDSKTDHLDNQSKKVENNFNRIGKTNLTGLNSSVNNVGSSLIKVDKNKLGGINDSVNTLGSNIRRVDKTNIGGLNNSFSGLASKIMGIGALMGAGLGIREIIQTTTDFQKQQAVLSTMFGDKQGEMYFQNLKKQAELLPASMGEITESFVKLNGIGINASNSDLKSLSDLASAAGKNILDAAGALQGAATGEFERLKALNVVARVNGDKITFMYKNQKTTVVNTTNSIKDYLISLGKMKGVAGSSEKIMSTMGGVVSNIGDSFASISFELGKQLLPLMKQLSTAVGWISSKMPAIIKFFNDWGFVIKPLLAGLAGFMIFTKLLLPLYEFIKAFKVLNTVMALNPVGAIIIALSALGVLLFDLKEKFGGWGKLWTSTWDTIKQSFETGFAAIDLIGYNWYTNLVLNLMRLKYIFKDLMSEVKRVSESSMLLVGGNYSAAMQVFNAPTATNDLSKEDLEIQRKLGKELGTRARTFRDLNIQMEKNKKNWLGTAGWGGSKTEAPTAPVADNTNIDTKTPLVGGLTELSSQSNVKMVTISVNKMIETLTFETVNLTESTGKIREEIIKVLQKTIADASSMQTN